jgi:hypothetical protein
MNQKMAYFFEPSWYKLFKRVDQDGSGRISLLEFQCLVRDDLQISQQELAERILLSLWKVLDDDGSGFVTAGEFGKFMRQGAAADPAIQKRKDLLQRQQLQRQAVHDKFLRDEEERKEHAVRGILGAASRLKHEATDIEAKLEVPRHQRTRIYMNKKA